MIINYGAQWLKLSPVIEFKEFAQYVIPLFALPFSSAWGEAVINKPQPNV
jgi:hypothetical protein